MIPETGAEHVVGLSPCDQWGPFSTTITDTERKARLRSLRSIAHLILGPRSEPLASLLAMCEADPGFLDHAAEELNRVPSRDRRSILASYGAVNCKNWRR